jgi:Short C-terminal domain
MMLIRPPVVREMRRNLWVKMTATPDHQRIQPETASPVASEADVRLDRLKSLGDLRVSGVLTEEEFERVKARILA